MMYTKTDWSDVGGRSTWIQEVRIPTATGLTTEKNKLRDAVKALDDAQTAKDNADANLISKKTIAKDNFITENSLDSTSYSSAITADECQVIIYESPGFTYSSSNILTDEQQTLINKQLTIQNLEIE